MRCKVILLLASSLVASAWMCRADETDEHNSVVVAIKAAGGNWSVDEAADDKPVIKVELNSSEILTDATLEHLTGLPKLAELNLAYTNVSDDSLTIIARMKSLERLTLRRTLISNEGLKKLNDLPKIRALDLSSMRINDSGLQHLQKLPCLEELNLRGTWISPAGLKSLAEIKSLRVINLADTSVTLADFLASDLKGIKTLYLDAPHISAWIPSDAPRRPIAADFRLQLTPYGRDTEVRCDDEDLRLSWLVSRHLRESQQTSQSKIEELASTVTTNTPVRTAWSVIANSSKRELQLKNASIDGFKAREVDQYSELRRLTLVDTQIGSELFQLPIMDRLVELELRDCRISDSAWATARQPLKLESVIFVGTPGGDKALRTLCQSKVRRLTLDGARLTETSLSLVAAGSAESLEELSLNYALLTSDGIAALAACHKLRVLQASETLIDDDMLKSIAMCAELESLNLELTKVTDAALPMLVKLPKLKTLNLRRTSVTDVGIRTLAGCPSLESLDVRESKVTAVGAGWLQQKRPQIQVIE